MEKTSST